ncbi:MAG: carbon storage regulator [Planctomycetaceae bacterium]|nr:carbon storage regulator [Planctomycetaceae bacterium]
MLVLSRKSREAVVVGTGEGADHLLKVIVLEIGNGKVKLGFEVDADVPVNRMEVWERICAERALECSRAGPEASCFD